LTAIDRRPFSETGVDLFRCVIEVGHADKRMHQPPCFKTPKIPYFGRNSIGPDLSGLQARNRVAACRGIALFGRDDRQPRSGTLQPSAPGLPPVETGHVRSHDPHPPQAPSRLDMGAPLQSQHGDTARALNRTLRAGRDVSRIEGPDEGGWLHGRDPWQGERVPLPADGRSAGEATGLCAD
jgi:hypothetical protein